MKLSRKEAEALGIPVEPQKRSSKAAQKWNGNSPASKPKKPRKAPNTAFMDSMCEAHGLPIPIPEFTFAPPRKWRFDWLFGGWLALEVQGGLFTQGRHTRGDRLLDEHEKLNEAVCLGFSVLFCVPADIDSGAVFPVIARALGLLEEQS